MISEEMVKVVNARIDELLANESVQELIMREKANGMTEDGLKDLIHNLAIGTLCFGEKK